MRLKNKSMDTKSYEILHAKTYTMEETTTEEERQKERDKDGLGSLKVIATSFD